MTADYKYYSIREEDDGELVAYYGDYTLRSHLQPILACEDNSRTVLIGAEALARVALNDQPIRTEAFFDNLPDSEVKARDQLCRALHLASFATVNDGLMRLFLNIFPESCASAEDAIAAARMITGYLFPLGINPKQVVCEIIEAKVDDLGALKEVTQSIREAGALIAIDDFGCRYSNIDRIFELKPDIVKLDAMIVRRAGEFNSGPRMLSAIINMIHEMGALALVEGIEGRSEMDMALESGADLLQGYFIGRPTASQTGMEDTKERDRKNFLSGFIG
ncbi:EAL domain-containing protein [Coralliovum pocilloporae]|uniref:EAL domain-containing protein n=1 Tax=Coralliovum pocilloporae TaxID=3066369 RepID=UPI003307C662